MAPVTIEENQKQLREIVLSNAIAPEKEVLVIWNVLIDGKDHSGNELLTVAEYSRPDSTGCREVMKWFKKLELVE